MGQFVILTDGKLIEGAVTKDGDRVLVRRGAINQPYTKEQVHFIGNSKEEVYQHLLGKLKADDPVARMKLARWCMFNGMREHALTEAREVVRLQPTNKTAAEMARTLDESLRLFPTGGEAARPPAPTTPPAPGLPAVPPPAGLGVSVVPGGEGGFATNGMTQGDPAVSPDAVVTFGPKVQPILANLCADCHARPNYAGAFKLSPATSVTADPETTRHNLRVSAAQIKKDNPDISPLLVKALAAHGGMRQPAFFTREAPAFRALVTWVSLATGTPAPTATPSAGAGATPTTPAAPASTASTFAGLPTVPPPPSLPAQPQPSANGKSVLPNVPPPELSPALPMVSAPTIPKLPPAIPSAVVPVVNPPQPIPLVAPSPPAPPPIPPAAEGSNFGQYAPPLGPVTPGSNNAGEALDEFAPAHFNDANPPKPPPTLPTPPRR